MESNLKERISNVDIIEQFNVFATLTGRENFDGYKNWLSSQKYENLIPYFKSLVNISSGDIVSTRKREYFAAKLLIVSTELSARESIANLSDSKTK